LAVTGDPKWHERTPTLLAASVAALAAIGLIVWLTTVVVRQVNTPAPAPTEYIAPFVDNSGTSTSSSSEASSSTSSKPVETTDISDVIGPPSSTSSSLTPPRTRKRTSTESPAPGEDDQDSTTRRKPRYNETRTLYPQP
jgi:cytoskeletal protein RodZ